MRGSSKLKKIHENNNRIINLLIRSYFFYTIIVQALYYYKGFSFLLCVFLSLIEILCIFSIYKRIKPKCVLENNTLKILDVKKIDEPGINSLLFDILFWSMISHILIYFSWKFSFMYLGILFSILNEIIYKPYKKLRSILNKRD